MVNENDLIINCEEIEKKIIDFIKKILNQTNLKGAVVGCSGGIDSSVTLSLTVKALGSKNVTAITLPERDVTHQSDITDVIQLCEQLDLTCNTIDITPILHVIENTLPNYDQSELISNGNIKARLRMIILYYYANIQKKFVIGTSNKTELLTGFFTKYGDGGVDVMPLGDLYKTQLRQLAKYLKIPKTIIAKPPSPGFYRGQTDERELGIDYLTLDLILFSWKMGRNNNEIAKDLSVPLEKIELIQSRVKANEHKRRTPLILRLS